MIFQFRNVADCVGLMLGHSTAIDGHRLRKGHWLTQADIDAVIAAGTPTLFAGQKEPGDVLENDAALQIAETAAGNHVGIEKPHTGRANLIAQCDGVLIYSRNDLISLNETDPKITLAMVSPFSTVRKNDLVGTVKIIPFAVQRSALESASNVLQQSALCSIAPFENRPCALLETTLEAVKPLSDKILRFTKQRIERVNLHLTDKAECPHTPQAAANWIERTAKTLSGDGVLLVFGASATVDEADVIPAAISLAGGRVERVGMAADPGNLLVFGKLGRSTIIGLPGCAKSPALNGFDWVLERTAAGLDISPRDWAEMSVGGLLKEIEARPQLRRPTQYDENP
ncbi:MAG: molybdopterin-binding protein [Pseudomonadota bacterium]